jgi:hypothetical protein
MVPYQIEEKVRKLLLYEYVAENIETDANTINVNGDDDDDDEHRDFTRQSRVYQTLKTKSAHDLVSIKLKSFDRTLIFAGCLDGSICVVRWDNLDLDYEIEVIRLEYYYCALFFQAHFFTQLQSLTYLHKPNCGF